MFASLGFKPSVALFTGDKEKAPQPISDYRDRFRGDAVDRVPLAKAVVGPSTIRGDERAHAYNTTHQENYKGAWQIPPEPVAAVSSTMALV